MGPDRRQREISISGAGRRAEPGNRDGGNRAKGRSGAGAGALRETIALGESRRVEQGHRLAASGRRDTGGDGRASQAQQNFQCDPAGLEAGQAVVFTAAKKYRRVDRSGGASAGGRRDSPGGLDSVSEATGAGNRGAYAPSAGRARGRRY